MRYQRLVGNEVVDAVWGEDAGSRRNGADQTGRNQEQLGSGVESHYETSLAMATKLPGYLLLAPSSMPPPDVNRSR